MREWRGKAHPFARHWVRGQSMDDTTSSAVEPRRHGIDPHGAGGALGLNGIMVWKAANVSVENLTACNFLGGRAPSGNEIW